MSSHFRLPYGYSGAPPWPALYWPFSSDFDAANLIADVPHSLYYLRGMGPKCSCIKQSISHIRLDIWKFTVIWSVIFGLAVYLPAGNNVACKEKVERKNSRWSTRYVGIPHVCQGQNFAMVHVDHDTVHLCRCRVLGILCYRQYYR